MMGKTAFGIFALSFIMAMVQDANAISNRYILTCEGDVLVHARENYVSPPAPIDEYMQSGVSIFSNVENSFGPITRTFEVSPRFVSQSDITGQLHSFRQNDLGKKYFNTGVNFKATQDEVNDFVEKHLAAKRKKIPHTDTYDYEVTDVFGIYIRVEKSSEPYSDFFMTAFSDLGSSETIMANKTGAFVFKKLPNTKLRCTLKK